MNIFRWAFHPLGAFVVLFAIASGLLSLALSPAWAFGFGFLLAGSVWFGFAAYFGKQLHAMEAAERRRQDIALELARIAEDHFARSRSRLEIVSANPITSVDEVDDYLPHAHVSPRWLAEMRDDAARS